MSNDRRGIEDLRAWRKDLAARVEVAAAKSDEMVRFARLEAQRDLMARRVEWEDEHGEPETGR